MNLTAPFGRAGLVVVAVAGLVGCASKATDEAGTACPPTQIAVPTDRIGHSDEQGNLRYIATMERLTSSCREDGEHIEIDIAFDLKAERGPVFEDKPILMTYYVATVDPQREIVDKQLLKVRIELAPEQTESSIRESVTLRLPAPSEASGANYNLYLGFQPDQQPG